MKLLIILSLLHVKPFVLSNPDNILNLLDLKDCPYQVEPIGCFHDGYPIRALPHQILNSRDQSSHVFQKPLIQWRNYGPWLSNFICECAKKLFKQKDVRTDYIGLQFFGECWANLEKHVSSHYDIYGESSRCIEHTFQPYIPFIHTNPYKREKQLKHCGLYIGTDLNNFVYKVTKYSSSCYELKGHYKSTNGEQLAFELIDGSFVKGYHTKFIQGAFLKKLSNKITEDCHGFIYYNSHSESFSYDSKKCELDIHGIGKFKKVNCEEGSCSLKGHYKSTNEGNLTFESVDDHNHLKGYHTKLIEGEITKECQGFIINSKKNVHLNKNFVFDFTKCDLVIGGNRKFKKTNCEEDDIPCPAFVSKGCWKDPLPFAQPAKRPMEIYAMNERDPYASNWNKRFIDWKEWGNGYLASLICRCAKVAKKTKKKYFSIQFYGECWTSNREEFNKYKNVKSCVDDTWNQCPSIGNQCRTPLCAGKWETNKVYELV